MKWVMSQGKAILIVEELVAQEDGERDVSVSSIAESLGKKLEWVVSRKLEVEVVPARD